MLHRVLSSQVRMVVELAPNGSLLPPFYLLDWSALTAGLKDLQTDIRLLERLNNHLPLNSGNTKEISC